VPSGRTHDRITYITAGLLTPPSLYVGYLTQHHEITPIFVANYMFAGLMFGPDLDLKSIQYRRWAMLRWIWLPYQKATSHRAFWTHGFVAGTAIRLCYLLAWLSIPAIALVLWVPELSHLLEIWMQAVLDHPYIWFTALVGLEAGAMSHTIADMLVSEFKSKRRRRDL
jgi:uncharacterized metal-binding protein